MSSTNYSERNKMKNLTAVFCKRQTNALLALLLVALAVLATIPNRTYSIEGVSSQQSGNSKSTSSVTVARAKLPKRPGVAAPVKKA